MQYVEQAWRPVIEVLVRRATGICGQPATQSGGRKPFWERGHLARHLIARKRDLSDQARWRGFLTRDLLQNYRAHARLGAGRMPALPGKRMAGRCISIARVAAVEAGWVI